MEMFLYLFVPSLRWIDTTRGKRAKVEGIRLESISGYHPSGLEPALSHGISVGESINAPDVETKMEATIGLCTSCRHAKSLRTKGGTVIYLCGLSLSDPRFPRYPQLPVKTCPGYDVVSEVEDSPPKSG